jgi:hypothetical protein
MKFVLASFYLEIAYFFEIFPSRQLVYAFEDIFPTYFNMDSLSDIFLTVTNWFSWKARMEDVLRSKGHYHITLGK